MQTRTKLYIIIGLVGVTLGREAGLFDFSLAQTAMAQDSSKIFSPHQRPERAYRGATVRVLKAGEGSPEFSVGPTDTVSWTIQLDEPEFSGLDWLPLYKRLTYRVEAQAGNLEGVTVGGESLRGRPEDGSPHGVQAEFEGTVTAIGIQSRRGLRNEVIDAVCAELVESLTADLLEMEPAEASGG